MKRTSILIAMFAVIAAAPAAKAQVDFEGNSIKNKIPSLRTIVTELTTNISDNNKALNIAEPQPQAYNLEVVASEIKKADNSIKSATEYCKNNNLPIMENNFKNLLAYGTPEEKRESLKKHEIPARISLMNNPKKHSGDTFLAARTRGTQKGVNPVCMKWDTQQICVDKEKCDNVCDASALVCVAMGGNGACAVWGPACHIVCRIIKDCQDWPVCVEWYHDVY